MPLDQFALPFAAQKVELPAPVDLAVAATRDRQRRVRVPCRRAFAEGVLALCRSKGLAPGDLVGAAEAIFPSALIDGFEDPGPPRPEDAAVTFRAKAGGGARRVRTTPAILVATRRPAEAARIRRCLAMALALSDGDRWRLLHADTIQAWHAAWAERERELRLDRDLVEESLRRLAFRPVPGGVRSVAQAVRVMGLASEFGCTADAVNRRFRELAPVFHPDTGLLGCPERMRQLIEARKLLLEFAQG